MILIFTVLILDHQRQERFRMRRRHPETLPLLATLMN